MTAHGICMSDDFVWIFQSIHWYFLAPHGFPLFRNERHLHFLRQRLGFLLRFSSSLWGSHFRKIERKTFWEDARQEKRWSTGQDILKNYHPSNVITPRNLPIGNSVSSPSCCYFSILDRVSSPSIAHDPIGGRKSNLISGPQLDVLMAMIPWPHTTSIIWHHRKMVEEIITEPRWTHNDVTSPKKCSVSPVMNRPDPVHPNLGFWICRSLLRSDSCLWAAISAKNAKFGGILPRIWTIHHRRLF